MLSAIATPVQAGAYCIKGNDWLSPVGDCSFSSYRQCQASASGRRAYCERNPFASRAEMRAQGPPPLLTGAKSEARIQASLSRFIRLLLVDGALTLSGSTPPALRYSFVPLSRLPDRQRD